MKHNDTTFANCDTTELPLAYIREIQAAQKTDDSRRLEFLSSWGRKHHVELTNNIPRPRGQPVKRGVLIRVPCRFGSQADYDLVVAKIDIEERASILLKAAQQK